MATDLTAFPVAL